MKSINPLQLDIRQNVFEHDRRQYWVVSATLCTHLLTGEVVLSFDYLGKILEGQSESVNLDVGMPKPQGEFLVTGSFHAPQGIPVQAAEIALSLGGFTKRLTVFGERRWNGTFPGQPSPFTSLPLDYAYAFGGEGFSRTPSGRGYRDGLLPRIEHPDRLVTNEGEEPDPAGLAALPMDWPQRTRYRGTYDAGYLKKYYPGHPHDFDWHYFLSAPQDQWCRGFWRGDEPFTLCNLHPDMPILQGRLPGYKARCFIRHTLHGPDPGFAEIPLALDTIWFFPGQVLALQIWRGVLEVPDDEASPISHLLAGYENTAHPPRDVDQYRQALARRLDNKDPLSNSLITEDLIPVGAPCAMEILQQRAFTGDDQSPLVKNIGTKAAAARKMAEEKVEEAIRQAEQELGALDLPENKQVDLRGMLQAAREGKVDPDQEAFTGKLESILPGITADDPRKIDMKQFSFAKIDQMMQAVRDFSEKKEKEAKTLAKAEIAHAKETLAKQLAPSAAGDPGVPDADRARLERELQNLAELDLDTPAPGPLPRINADALLQQMAPVTPMVQEALQHLHSMQAIGIKDERTEEMERQVKEMYDQRMGEIEEKVRQAEKDFKETYTMGAHFMAVGLPPHERPIEEMRAQFLQAVAAGERVSGRDWACIDLQGAQLDGLDLSGCYLEQVNFTGASLKGATLSQAILARSVLTDADLSGADLQRANIGAVSAHRANFTGADLQGAKLSRGDFTAANFTGANLENVESLEIIIAEAVFDQARLLRMKFIERQVAGARFREANLDGALFFNCTVRDTDFSTASMPHVVWADCSLDSVRFDGADLSSACFVATEEGKSTLNNVHFPGARLDRSTFQNLRMPGADLSRSSMEGALFNGTDLSGADLSHAFAQQAQFRTTNFNGARLDHIDLCQGSLAKAQLTNASLASANLYAVDCLRCKVGNTDFRGANLDATLLEEEIAQ